MFYSQCEEDILLNNNYFKNKKNGVYLELGALDGVLYSNTKFFEDTLGWKGILIEPHPDKFKSLIKNRPNNKFFNNLVSCHKEPLKFRYFIDNMAAVSGVETTLSKNHLNVFFESTNEWKKAQPQNTISIIPRSLTDIIKSTSITHIDFMSLDVEGHEYEVLQSWDFSIPIDLILIETLGTEPHKEALCRQILLENQYIYSKKIAHNEIFVLKTSPYAI